MTIENKDFGYTYTFNNKTYNTKTARNWLESNNRDTWKLDPRSKKHSKPESETEYCLVTWW